MHIQSYNKLAKEGNLVKKIGKEYSLWKMWFSPTKESQTAIFNPSLMESQLGQSRKRWKRRKGIVISKEETKLSVFMDTSVG